MSRTAPLFKLIDALRARCHPVTAAQLSAQLAVSVRTAYRDVQTLVDLGGRIDGGAGVGYVLRAGFFLPPLMFDDDEIEALLLDARWVAGQGDAHVARAAVSAGEDRHCLHDRQIAPSRRVHRCHRAALHGPAPR
jgi:predicted DNA-binding transcriptional regulator YafY